MDTALALPTPTRSPTSPERHRHARAHLTRAHQTGTQLAPFGFDEAAPPARRLPHVLHPALSRACAPLNWDTLGDDTNPHAGEAIDVSDESLMDAYCAGDIEAFNELFTRFSRRIVRFLTSMVGREKAEDLTQLTFMKVHQNRHRYQAGKSVAAWFFAIARNNALDYVRSAPKRREVFGLELEHGKDAPSFDRLRDAQVREALTQLTEDQQNVIQLHWFADLTFEEVAQAVGASPAAVRVRAHRGYEKLRGLLAKLHAEVTS